MERPGAGGLAWTQRGAELRAFGGRARPSDRALRELLALQSSDWAFLISAGTAGDYPRERAEAHRAGFEAALADPAMSRKCGIWRRCSEGFAGARADHSGGGGA